MKLPDFAALNDSLDISRAIIELDVYIGSLCDHGDSLGTLTAPQLTFYLNQQFEREINNGGFNQFLFNSTGSFAHETVSSLNAIEARRTSELLQTAIQEFPNRSVPIDDSERRTLILTLWPDGDNPVWEELDRKFFVYEDNLDALNLAFVKANQHQFN